MSRISQLVLLSLTLAIGGCASKVATNGQKSTIAGVDSRLSAAENLSRAAKREAAESKPLDARAVAAVAIPPGVEPALLKARDQGDVRAFATIENVLAEFAQRDPSETLSAEAVPVDPEAQNEATRLYAKARSESLDGRTLQAIVDLQKAQKLDPNSPEIIRELARCYANENRTTQALELYDQLLHLMPDNPEALFTIGIASASRRDFDRALSALARFKQTSDRRDPSSDVLVDFTLATALRELGYDHASIQAAINTLELPAELVSGVNAMRLASVYRQRGEVLRMIGDAHCRLGEYDDALAAYLQAASVPMADPTTLHPRVIYANLCLGRPIAAQSEMLSVLQAQPGAISDRDVRLCAYLNENAKPAKLLADAVNQMYLAHPEESSLARAAASLRSPAEALDLLRSFVARQPRDLDSVEHLLGWMAQQDANAAAELAITLGSEYPDLADAYADRLALVLMPPSVALRAVQHAPPSASRAHMEAKLLWKFGGLGEAWSVCEAGRKQWPDDRGLALEQLQLAAALQEKALFKRIAATAPPFETVAGLIALSQAYRAAGEFQTALDLARQASDQDPASVDAIIELARASISLGASLANDPEKAAPSREAINNAIAYADQAIAKAPQRDDAFEVLVVTYGPKGVLSDTSLYQQTLQKLREANPQSPLFARLAAQDAVAQRRFEQALDRIINLCENPLDTESLKLAVAIWQEWGRLDSAEQWLAQHLQQRPGDPSLTRQLILVKLRRGETETVLKQLEQAVQSDSQDFVARDLLESVYRSNGQSEAAMQIGEKRLLARPQGVRRELELAALYAGAEHAGAAFERLDWIRAHTEEADTDEIAGALQVINHIKGDDARRDAMSLDLVNQVVARHPESPLQIYGAGLRALARSGKLDDRFDQLAIQAAEKAREGSGPSLKDAAEWRELAQALVDDHQPQAAARALRVRLQSPSPIDPNGRNVLARITIILDAAADAAHPAQENIDNTAAMLQSLNARGELQRVFDSDTKLTLGAALYEASVFYTMVGSREGADALLRRSLELEPDQPMALNNLGYALLETGQHQDEATEFIERAAVLQPNEPNILDTVGWLRYKQGRLEDEAFPAGDGQEPGALTLIQRAIANWRVPSPEVLDHLGDVQWRLGHTSAATEAWEQAVKITENDSFQKLITQSLQFDQAQNWQILVIDPRTMYDREYGPILQRAKEKLQAAKAGEQPKIAPLFSEANLSHE